MAGSVYPGALDDFAESSPTYMSDPDATGRTHEGRHNDVESAIEAVQAALGINPPRFRFDETVGRRLFATDKNNGNREQMVYGDTGWRLMPNSQNTGDCYLRRVGSTVWVSGSGLATLSTDYWANVMDIPAGFRALTTGVTGVGRSSTTGSLHAVAPYGPFLAVAGAALTESYDIGTQWSTIEPWPSTLPGTAAGGGIPTLLPVADDTTSDIDPVIPTGIAQ